MCVNENNITNLLFKPETLEHGLKCIGKSLACVRLRNFHDIEQKCKHNPFVLQVDGPRNERTMIRRGPCIGGKM